MKDFNYQKSNKYNDYDTIYAQCSGPGGLQLAEFLATKMGVKPNSKLLDIGCNRGYQTCFLVKEFDVFAVGIDPWDDREQGNPMIEHLQQNAIKWGVENKIIGQKIGVPETHFAPESFDFVYSTTALEMVRGSHGEQGYNDSMKEILRVLKPGGIFGIAEPMHLDVEIPEDIEPYVSQGEYSWKKCFRSLNETRKSIEDVGFEIIESEYAPDAHNWWLAFIKHDPFCKKDPEDDPKVYAIDNGRWTSFGYIIARKPVE